MPDLMFKYFMRCVHVPGLINRITLRFNGGCGRPLETIVRFFSNLLSATLYDSIANVVYKNLVTKFLVVREVRKRFGDAQLRYHPLI